MFLRTSLSTNDGSEPGSTERARDLSAGMEAEEMMESPERCGPPRTRGGSPAAALAAAAMKDELAIGLCTEEALREAAEAEVARDSASEEEESERARYNEDEVDEEDNEDEEDEDDDAMVSSEMAREWEVGSLIEAGASGRESDEAVVGDVANMEGNMEGRGSRGGNEVTRGRHVNEGGRRDCLDDPPTPAAADDDDDDDDDDDACDAVDTGASDAAADEEEGIGIRPSEALTICTCFSMIHLTSIGWVSDSGTIIDCGSCCMEGSMPIEGSAACPSSWESCCIGGGGGFHGT